MNWKDGPTKFRGYAAKILNDPHVPIRVIALRMSLKRALQDKQRRASTLSAVESEIHNMEERAVTIMIYYNNIPHDQRKFIIPAHMFIKDKFKANGTFDKTKARLVVNGD